MSSCALFHGRIAPRPREVVHQALQRPQAEGVTKRDQFATVEVVAGGAARADDVTADGQGRGAMGAVKHRDALLLPQGLGS